MESERQLSFAALTESFEGRPPEYSLARTLGLHPDAVKLAGPFFLREVNPGAPLAAEATRFATAYRAYYCFQDLMEAVLHFDAPNEHRHYCYYESLGYLREIGHTLLSGNFLATLTLIRPFLELSVLHLYWRAREDEYAQFYRWMQTGEGKPPFRNCVEELFKNTPTIARISEKRAHYLSQSVLAIYRDACAYTHVAKLDESYVALSGGNQRATASGASIALAQAQRCLGSVLFLYALAYPMVLFPLPVHRKFGMGGPVGLFAPHEACALFEAAVGEVEVESLRRRLRDDDNVMARHDWFNARQDLSDEEIEADWQDHLVRIPMTDPPSDLRSRLATVRAQIRAISWSFNYAGVASPIAAPEESAAAEPAAW